MKSISLLLLAVAPLALVACGGGEHANHNGGGAQTAADENTEPQIWTCSMHPNVQAPEFGLCPICAMDLIPLAPGANSPGVTLSHEANTQAELVTVVVERRPAVHTINLIGRLHQDETREATIAAWAGGRIERLFVDYTGVEVREGDHLVELYSLDLFNAQQDFVVALNSLDKASASQDNYISKLAADTVVAAETRLLQYGLSAAQIDALRTTRKAQDTIEMQAPIGGVVVKKNAKLGQYVKEGQELFTISDLSKLWLVLHAYEKDLSWLRYGQQVDFQVDAFAGETFTGKVVFFDREIDMKTRTVGVRVEVDNADLRLRPGMLSRAGIQANLASDGHVHSGAVAKEFMCPMHHEVVSDFAGDCSKCGMPLESAASLGYDAAAQTEFPLLIPASAPMITGKRALVYIQSENTPDGVVYEPREVILGPRAADWFVVKEGLEEGDIVVAQSAFVLDSEQQINGKFSMMSADQAPTSVKKADGIPFPVQKQLGSALALNVNLSKALAADDLPAALKIVSQMKQIVSQIDIDSISLDTFTDFRKDLNEMVSKLNAMSVHDDIEKARVDFEYVELNAVAFAAKYPYHTKRGKLAVFHCPMAFNDRGANWVQFSGEEVENPYFGASMYRCGLEQSLVPKVK
ncbi:MAG: efflux RND transporter periplasmic adaptor subunit [Planctomycetes bacterium]|nr:efflux RND transporter periplasmic adaptor subunit [Planctomycetota bacterium]